MTNKEFTSLIDNIDLSDIRHEFENVHTYYFGLDLHTSFDKYDVYLDCDFYVYGTNEKNGFNLIELNVKFVDLWLNDSEKHYLTDSQLLELQKVLTKKLKELL